MHARARAPASWWELPSLNALQKYQRGGFCVNFSTANVQQKTANLTKRVPNCRNLEPVLWPFGYDSLAEADQEVRTGTRRHKRDSIEAKERPRGTP